MVNKNNDKKGEDKDSQVNSKKNVFQSMLKDIDFSRIDKSSQKDIDIDKLSETQKLKLNLDYLTPIEERKI